VTAKVQGTSATACPRVVPERGQIGVDDVESAPEERAATFFTRTNAG
jgi:hypothetical protein